MTQVGGRNNFNSDVIRACGCGAVELAVVMRMMVLVRAMRQSFTSVSASVMILGYAATWKDVRGSMKSRQRGLVFQWKLRAW